MNDKAISPVDACLSEDVIARILTGDELVGEQEIGTSLHLEACRRCRDILDQRLNDALSELPDRIPELGACNKEKVDSLVQKLMESERLGELQLHDQTIREHIDQGNGPYPFGDFELIRYIGGGGMGSVYEALDTRLGRCCAVKLINSGIYATENETQRFLREGNAAALLEHPNIVTVFSVGQHCDSTELDRYYIAMQMIHGESLENKIQSGIPIGERQIAKWIKQVSQGLAHAHGDNTENLKSVEGLPPVVIHSSSGQPRERIVHRDIKPGNILIDLNGNAKIIDFGLAKIGKAEQCLTRNGSLLGTPAYMSPEQTSGGLDDVGPGSDIFSLGSVLYELLTGKRPFDGKSERDTLNLICDHDPIAPRKLAHSISLDIETICLKCLEKEPGKRYASASELVDDLDAFLEGRPIRARRIGRLGTAWKWCKRNPVSAIVATALAVVCGSAAALGVAAYLAEQRNKDSQKLLAAMTELREQEDYFYKIRTANFEWENNRLDLMENALESCPTNRRNVEWHLLNNNCLHQELLTIKNTGGPITGLQWSPGAESLVICGNEKIDFWDVKKNRMERSLPVSSDFTIAFCSEKQLIAAGCQKSSEIELIGLTDGSKIRSLQGLKFDADHTLKLSFDPTGNWLVGGASGTVCVWEMDSGTLLNTWNVSNQEFRCLKFHPSQPWLVTVSRRDEKKPQIPNVTLWEVPAGNRIQDFFEPDPNKWPSAADFSPDGKWLVTGTMRDPRAAHIQETAIWDVATGKKVDRVAAHTGGVSAVKFHPLRPELLTAGQDSLIYLREYSETGEFLSDKVRKFRGYGQSGWAEFDANGSLFATSDDDGIHVWDDSKSQGPLRFEGHPNSGAFSVAISPDGKTFATGGSRGCVKLSNIETGKEFREFIGLEQDLDYVVFGLAFSPDGKRLAGVGRGVEKQGVLWDVETGKKIAEFTIGTTASGSKYGDIRTVAFDPSGKLLITGGNGGFLRVWNAVDGTLVHEWPVAAGSITQLAFSPDGRLCVVGEPVDPNDNHLTVRRVAGENLPKLVLV